MSVKKEDVINLITSQTNYTEEKALEKLTEWNGNYIYVIKEYLNPNFLQKKKKPSKSKNQKIMSEIRNFMDTANRQYLERKKIEDRKKAELEKVRQQFLAEKQKHPNCLFDPPNSYTCTLDCQNPLCPKEKDARELLKQ